MSSSNALLGLTFDHIDIIGSIADGQRDGFLVLLHQTHHIGLLLWGDTAADDRLTLAGHVYKVDLWRHLTVSASCTASRLRVSVSWNVSHLSSHLSHLFLPVIHGLAVLRGARRRSLSKAAQAQTAPFFFLFVQNFILKERTATLLRLHLQMKPDCYSGSF